MKAMSFLGRSGGHARWRYTIPRVKNRRLAMSHAYARRRAQREWLREREQQEWRSSARMRRAVLGGDRWHAFECVGCPAAVGSGCVWDVRLPSGVEALTLPCPACGRPTERRAHWLADVDGYGSRADGRRV